MSSYGFGKKTATTSGTDDAGAGRQGDRLDFSGIARTPVTLDPEREEAAIRRGDALGYVDRGTTINASTPSSSDAGSPRRRRRTAQPQISVFIKGPKDTLEWFIEYTNQRGHRSYWEALEELRLLVNDQQPTS